MSGGGVVVMVESEKGGQRSEITYPTKHCTSGGHTTLSSITSAFLSDDIPHVEVLAKDK